MSEQQQIINVCFAKMHILSSVWSTIKSFILSPALYNLIVLLHDKSLLIE